MKKICAITMLAAIALVTASCAKKSPEAQAKEIANDTITIMEDVATKLEKSADDKEAAKALTDFAVKMKVVYEKAKEFEKQNPGLKDKEKEFMKEESEKLEKSSKRFVAAMFSIIMKYPNSKDLMDAAKKLEEIDMKN